MKQKLKPETWVGLFLIAGILMIIGVILGFGNIKTSKEQTYPINIIQRCGGTHQGLTNPPGRRHGGESHQSP